jgi:excisionase family DNA binding protein
MAFEVYFSTKEIASRLGRSTRTVRRWVLEGRFGDGVVAMGSLMVPESAIEEFLSSSRLNLSAEAQAIRRDAMERRLDRDEPAQARVATPGTPARSAGELRRKALERWKVAEAHLCTK